MTRSRFIAGLTALVLASPVFAARPETRSLVVPQIDIRLETVGAWHALDVDNDLGTAPDMTTGLAAAQGNLYLFATLVDGIDVFTEFYLSSKHHQGEFSDREGYVLISKLPERVNIGPLRRIFDYIDIKGGHFEIDYGNQHWVRSDNAEVQRNPLIGNYVVDPNVVEGGAEVIGHHNWLHWVAGLGNGVNTEDFRQGREYSKHGKVMVEHPEKTWNVAGSVYAVDQSDSRFAAPATIGSKSGFLSGDRSGSRYSGLRPDTAASDPDFGQLFLGNGQDIFAWQADAGVGFGPLWLSGLFGFFEDADTNGAAAGSPEDQWTYYGGEARLDVSEHGYIAGRYSGASADRIGSADSEAKANRFQVGYGYHLADGILLKLEYLNQHMSKFPTAGSAIYTRYANGVRIEGVTVELSVAFGTAAPYDYSTSGFHSDED